MAINKRDWASIISLLVIPGAGMELYDSFGKLAFGPHDITSWWDYAKLFFLGAAVIAAAWDICCRLADLIESAAAAMIMGACFIYLTIGSGIFIVRGLFGYGWSTEGLYILGGLFLILIVSFIVFAVAEENEGREKAESEKELLATGDPEAVKKKREADAISAAEGHAWRRTVMRMKE